MMFVLEKGRFHPRSTYRAICVDTWNKAYHSGPLYLDIKILFGIVCSTSKIYPYMLFQYSVLGQSFCANTRISFRYVPFALFSDKHRQSRVEASSLTNVAGKDSSSHVWIQTLYYSLGGADLPPHRPLSSTPGKMTPNQRGCMSPH